MRRRGFFGAVAAGLAGIFLQKTAQPRASGFSVEELSNIASWQMRRHEVHADITLSAEDLADPARRQISLADALDRESGCWVDDAFDLDMDTVRIDMTTHKWWRTAAKHPPDPDEIRALVERLYQDL